MWGERNVGRKKFGAMGMRGNGNAGQRARHFRATDSARPGHLPDAVFAGDLSFGRNSLIDKALIGKSLIFKSLIGKALIGSQMGSIRMNRIQFHHINWSHGHLNHGPYALANRQGARITAGVQLARS